MKLNLGILYKNGKIVNHRSLLNVLFNPILRYFGFNLATVYKNNKLCGIQIMKTERSKNIKWDFNSYNDFDLIIKKRIIF
jgi:hypothetical protein